MLKCKGGKILMNDEIICVSWDIPIRIAVIAETKEQAVSYFKRMIGAESIQCNTQKGNNIIYTSPMLSVEYIEQYSYSCMGKRYNYFYCTKDVCDSDWYETCVAPYQIRDMFVRIVDNTEVTKEKS